MERIGLDEIVLILHKVRVMHSHELYECIGTINRCMHAPRHLPLMPVQNPLMCIVYMLQAAIEKTSKTLTTMVEMLKGLEDQHLQEKTKQADAESKLFLCIVTIYNS